MKDHPLILSVSFDRELLETRELLFQSVGYEVSSTARVAQAVELVRLQKFDLIVLGHSLGIDRERLIADLQKVTSAPILALHKEYGVSLKNVRNLFSMHPPDLLKAARETMDGSAWELAVGSK